MWHIALIMGRWEMRPRVTSGSVVGGGCWNSGSAAEHTCAMRVYKDEHYGIVGR